MTRCLEVAEVAIVEGLMVVLSLMLALKNSYANDFLEARERTLSEVFLRQADELQVVLEELVEKHLEKKEGLYVER